MDDLPAARSLTRSLDPLPGESLAGFLMRLSWRLRVTPHRLARAIRCSNGAPAQLSRRLLIDLDIPAFAQATALTLAEATELTLLPWASRYPPIAHTAGTAASDGPRAFDEWLFHDDRRYCPACLAGDGSPAQQRYGGPWKKLWHLPIVFACPQHQAFLSDGCPRRHPPDPDPGRLIIPTSEWVLHPLQCRCPADPSSRGRRRACCGARLDQPQPPSLNPSPTLLNAQKRLLDLLSPRSSPENSTRTFTDLRVIVALICAAWPASQDLLEPHATAALSDHVNQLNARNRKCRDTLPRGLIVTATLLTAAMTVLGHPEIQSDLIRRIQASQPTRPSRSPLAPVLARHQTACSPALREAAEPAIRRYRRQAGPGSPKAPARTGGYRPEHIPAFLEDAWFERHLAPLQCRPRLSRVLRRAAAVTLVQWSAGGSLGDAATYLGINPKGGQYAFTKDLYQWLDSDPARTRFTTALKNLAAELDATPSLLNYQHRRHALQAWSLGETAWAEIVDQLPPVPGPVQPTLDDRKRQEASAFIWARATQGEPRFAPRPIEADQPEHTQREWLQRRGTTWHHLARQAPLAHYAALKKLLIRHADLLTTTKIAHSPPVTESPPM